MKARPGRAAAALGPLACTSLSARPKKLSKPNLTLKFNQEFAEGLS